MSFIATAITDVGYVKKTNQDSLTVKIAYTPTGIVCMAVMCDGLGGLEQGEVASGNVVLAFERWFQQSFLETDTIWDEKRIKAAWEDIVYVMNKKIKAYGREKRIELGTTLTAVLFMQDKYFVIHVGDCRLYEFSQNCRQITKDQTLIAKELEQGLLTEEQAQMDERQNVLLQCIGVTERLQPDFFCQKTIPNATYLLCSDGFRHVLTEEELYQTCNPIHNTTQRTMQLNLQTLIEENKQRGERDNISAILVRTGNVTC